MTRSELEIQTENEILKSERLLIQKKQERLKDKQELYTIQFNPYTTPMKTYLKYKTKQNSYQSIWNKNRTNYYCKVILEGSSKIFKKHIIYYLLWGSAFAFISFLAALMRTKEGRIGSFFKKLAEFKDRVISIFK